MQQIHYTCSREHIRGALFEDLLKIDAEIKNFFHRAYRSSYEEQMIEDLLIFISVMYLNESTATSVRSENRT